MERKVHKGILGQLLGSFSSDERKLLIILGLLRSASTPTRGEREIHQYLRTKRGRQEMEGVKKSLSLRDKINLVRLSRSNDGAVLDSISKMNSLGLTKSQMLDAIKKFNNNIKKIKTPALEDPTNSPESQKYALFTCENCEFTIDARKDYEDSDLECPYCGSAMIGLKREEVHTKSGNDGEFNEANAVVDYTDEKKKTPRQSDDVSI